tara:strand:+ start:143 stop:643 length:501 start_codon:yes stop_codon:yes gene_type:complete
LKLFKTNLVSRPIFIALISLLIFFIPLHPTQAALDYGKQSLVGEDFSNMDLKGATFYLTDLHNADLSGSDLQGASLFGAKLENTNLSNSNLREVTMDSAVLEGTDLTNAVMEDAFAFNARFNDVKIKGTDFSNVPFNKNEINKLCDTADGINPFTKRSTRDTLGCD